MSCDHCPVGKGCKGELNPRFCEMAATDEGARRTLQKWAGIDPDLPYDPALVELPEDDAQVISNGRVAPRATFGILSDSRVRVGLLAPNINMGGGESWGLELLKTTQATLNWVGMVVKDDLAKTNDYMVEQTSKYVPIQFGLDKIADLASRCDVIVSWMVEDFAKWMGNSTCKLIWVDHFPHDAPYDEATKWCLKKADAIVGVSEVCTPGVPQEWLSRYKIIYNAVDVDKLVVKRNKVTMRASWNVPLTAPVAGFYARMALEKRPDAMIRLVQSLPTNWHVVMAGDTKPYPDEAAFLARMISQLPANVQSRLHLMPADPATGDFMNAIDVLVNPPLVESFGLSMCEAMAFGVPVVSTPFGVAKIRPELVYPIKLDDSGANLAAQVQAAKLGGPKLLAKTFATVACSPVTFGAAWTTLVGSVSGLPVILPNILSKATSFAKAMTAHAASGFERADEGTVSKRASICVTCPYLVGENTCGKCGCGLSAKRALATSTCPIGRW